MPPRIISEGSANKDGGSEEEQIKVDDFTPEIGDYKESNQPSLTVPILQNAPPSHSNPKRSQQNGVAVPIVISVKPTTATVTSESEGATKKKIVPIVEASGSTTASVITVAPILNDTQLTSKRVSNGFFTKKNQPPAGTEKSVFSVKPTTIQVYPEADDAPGNMNSSGVATGNTRNAVSNAKGGVSSTVAVMGKGATVGVSGAGGSSESYIPGTAASQTKWILVIVVVGVVGIVGIVVVVLLGFSGQPGAGNGPPQTTAASNAQTTSSSSSSGSGSGGAVQPCMCLCSDSIAPTTDPLSAYTISTHYALTCSTGFPSNGALLTSATLGVTALFADNAGTLFWLDGPTLTNIPSKIRYVLSGNTYSITPTGMSPVAQKMYQAAFDADGVLYVTTGTNKVYKCIMTTTTSQYAASCSIFAGSGTGAAETDGKGTAADFKNLWGIAIDTANSVMYVSSRSGNVIRKITMPEAVVTTFAGSGTSVSYSQDGSGTAAIFRLPTFLTMGPSGFLLVADYTCIRQIELANAAVTTIAGSTSTGGTAVAGAIASSILGNGLGQITYRDNAVYIVDNANEQIHFVAMKGGSCRVATLGGSLSGIDSWGSLSTATFKTPDAMAFAGSVLYVGTSSGCIDSIS
ncbi:UNVERIFIED_CONTAM: hypothetical protein HDU68_000858 [Siphonaria sp. JEL0065]|nr:hypothetical protein HDU68_000858 [Siphonaria sp. JEL0065]